MKGKESHFGPNVATFVPKWVFLNGSNKVLIGLSGVQFWSEIKSNSRCALNDAHDLRPNCTQFSYQRSNNY